MIDTHLIPTPRTRGLALLAVTSVLALGACSKGGNEAEAADAPATLTVGAENVIVVQEDTLEAGPAVSGTLAPEREAQVRAELSGSVVRMLVEAGQRVSAGQLLAQIDDAGVRDQVISARTGVASAQSSFETAQREVERMTTLLGAGAIAERDAESARRARDAAQAQLAGTRAQLASAQRQLDATRVTAPFAGVVGTRAVSAGDVVTPGTLVLTVVDPTAMRFEASVPAEQLEAARVGAPVRFAVNGYPTRRFEGRITRVSPVADPTTRQVRILVSVPNAGGQLVGGLFAEGRVASQRTRGLVAPFAAVNRRGVAPTVLRLKGGSVEAVTVQLGLRDDQSERIQLTAGVSAGDTLLTGAAQGISPGTPVRIGQPDDAAPTAQPIVKR